MLEKTFLVTVHGIPENSSLFSPFYFIPLLQQVLSNIQKRICKITHSSLISPYILSHHYDSTEVFSLSVSTPLCEISFLILLITASVVGKIIIPQNPTTLTPTYNEIRVASG